jgi:hypothetical protein
MNFTPSTHGMRVSQQRSQGAWTAQVQNLSFLQIDVLTLVICNGDSGLLPRGNRSSNRTGRAVRNKTENQDRPIAFKLLDAEQLFVIVVILNSCKSSQLLQHHQWGCRFRIPDRVRERNRMGRHADLIFRWGFLGVGFREIKRTKIAANPRLLGHF